MLRKSFYQELGGHRADAGDPERDSCGVSGAGGSRRCAARSPALIIDSVKQSVDTIRRPVARPAGEPMTTPDLEQRVAAVRRFSRFYTRQLGLLREEPGGDPILARPRRACSTSLRIARPSRRASSPPTSASTTAISAASCAASATTALLQKDARAERRAPEPHLDHREGPQGVRAAEQRLARSGRRDAGETFAGGPAARGRRDGGGGNAARARPHSASPIDPASASAGRHGLGHLGAWRDLRAGIRLGHHLRGAGRERSRPNSSRTSIRSASAAGSPRSTASASARCSSCARPTRSPSFAC